ncbi:MAG: beta strand repeat-containing protein [Planctomycetaceae bacterium]
MKMSSLWNGWKKTLATGSRKAPRTRRSGVESLETRQMLSASALFLPATGELSIELDTDADLVITSNNGNLSVQASFNGGPLQQINTVGTVPAANVLSIEVLGGDDGNTIDLGGVSGLQFTRLASIVIDGANGDDLIIGSPDLADSLIGGNGADTIQSQGGNDTIAGGDGADSITAGTGDDSISSGDGNDVVAGDDGNDTISAGNGQDTVNGGNGDDSVNGFNGQDSLLGDAGNDTLNGDGGTDTLDGGADNDLLFGGEFADSLLGNDGDDTLNGQGGGDFLFGNNGNDLITGNAGDDQADGGAGNDILNGSVGNDTMTGGDDDDTVQGGSGLDSLNGGAGNDRVLGQGGDDTLTGGGGADVLDGGDGVDLVQSGDQVQVAPVEISVSDVTSGPETDAAQFLFNAVTDLNYGSGRNATGRDLDIGDINGDGRPDIVTLLDGELSVSLNQGSGQFATGVIYPLSSNFGDKVQLADLDADGDLDVITSPRNPGGVTPVGTVLFNDGTGVFGAEVLLGTGFPFGSFGHDVGDLNGDGTVDLVFASFTGNNAFIVQPLFNDGTGTFLVGTSTAVSSNFLSDIVLGDWDNDGDLDAAVVDQNLDQIIILTNSGTGLFSISSVLAVTGATNANVFPTHIVRGDWDLDGDLDLAVNTGNDNSLLIFTNSGSGSFAQSQRLVTPGSTIQDGFTPGDFDGDGDLDLAAFPLSGIAEVTVFVNTAGVFGTAVNFTTTPQFAINFAAGARAADLNGDGTVDLATTDFGGNGNILLNSPSRAPVMNFTVSLSQPSLVPVTVDFQTANGTAVGGLDYVPTSGTLTFAPGETTKVVPVRVIGDDIPESNETFFLNLSNASNGVTFTDRQAQGLINDDDGGTNQPTLVISDATLNAEGNGITNLVFTVTLNGNVQGPVTVGFETGDLTALAGFDYTAVTGTLTFGPGNLTQTITVPILGDAVLEADETFVVNLLMANGATLLDSRGVGTIRNDDAQIAQLNDTLFGGEGDDILVGSIGDDFFNGQGGNDSILGGDGNDSLIGGAGMDTLDGQAGDDTLDGQGGDDSLIGGEGNDTFVLGNGAGGDDIVDGGNGFNSFLIVGTNSADTITVGQSAGSIVVSRGLATIKSGLCVQSITINALGGNDTINILDLSAVADGAVIVVNGGDGNDTINGVNALLGPTRLALNGNNGNDTIVGTNGDDSITGGAGIDSINGRAGNDLIAGDAGDDILAGGLGNDTINGGLGADFLTGQEGHDSMIGGDGNDTMRGFEGNDTLLGQVGDDLLNGMDGDDVIQGGVGQDQITGGAGNDSLDGGRNNDTINGNAGNDFIRGDHGHDFIHAGSDSDTVSGGDGDDTIIASDSADLLAGNDGNDQINAAGGNDTLVGGDGNDTLLGGGGSDVLLGGDGDDYINGQSGIDTIAGNQGIDTIVDPNSEIDETFTLSAVILALLDA